MPAPLRTVLLLVLLLAPAACQSPVERGDDDAEPDLQRLQSRATAAIAGLAEVADARLHLVAEPGLSRIAHVAVTLRLAEDATMSEPLARQVVGHVSDAFPDLPAHHIAVRIADDDEFVYVGGVGVIE